MRRSVNDAGKSARELSESVGRAAEHWERKAANARRAEQNYAAGAAGEVAVAEALAPLTAAGWHVLNDREMPGGGNIDHIVVGPGAVIVLDAKAWNSTLGVRNGQLYASGRNKSRELQQLDRQAQAIRGVVGENVLINQALVITTQPDFEPQFVGAAGILGLNALFREINETPTVFTSAEVDSMLAKLIEAFPASGTSPALGSGLQVVDGVEPSELFNRANRFLYLNQWRKHGKHNVYLKDEHGEELGMKDLLSGSIRLTHPDDNLAQAVLAAATSTGVELKPSDLPKLPIDVRGGRLLGMFGRIYTTAMIGSIWTGKGKRYLYCTLANPTEGVFDLGHVDMSNGWVKPKSQGPVSRDRGPAERYLALLRDRYPTRG